MNKISDKEDKVKKDRGLLFLMIVFFTVGLTLYFVGKELVKYVISQGYFYIYIFNPKKTHKFLFNIHRKLPILIL